MRHGYAMDTPKVRHGYARGTPRIRQGYAMNTARVHYRYAKGSLWMRQRLPNPENINSKSFFPPQK